MPEKLVKELKVGDKIVVEGILAVIEKVEFSNIGKHGRSKCRLECVMKTGEKKVLVRVAETSIEVPE